MLNRRQFAIGAVANKRMPGLMGQYVCGRRPACALQGVDKLEQF